MVQDHRYPYRANTNQASMSLGSSEEILIESKEEAHVQLVLINPTNLLHLSPWSLLSLTEWSLPQNHYINFLYHFRTFQT